MQNPSHTERPISHATTDSRMGLWATVVALFFAAAPATYPGYWQSSQGFAPIFNVARSSAIADIATAPDFWRGIGSATFLLAQPLYALDLLSSSAAIRVTLIFALVIGALGMYAWLAPKLGDLAAGLSATVYVLCPPCLTTVYERGDVSAALILGLLPLVLMGAGGYRRTRSLSGLGMIVIGVLWMWRVQAGMAVFATALILLYIGIVERAWRAAVTAAVGGALGASTWLLFGHIQNEPTISFMDSFAPFYQLLLNRLLPTSIDMVPDAVMSPHIVQLGIALLGFGILSLWSWFANSRSPRDDGPTEPTDLSASVSTLLWFSLSVSVVLILLSLVVSRPLWQLTGGERLLTYPAQVLLLGLPFLAVLAGSLPAINREFASGPYWVTLVLVALLGAAPYLVPLYTQIDPGERPLAIVGERNEAVILEAVLMEDLTVPLEPPEPDPYGRPPENDPPEAILEVTWQTLNQPTFDYNIFFQALMPVDDKMEVVAQIDVQPLEGERPASTWRQGELLTERYRLDLSEFAERTAGDTAKLHYYFGYYDWREGGERLPIRLGYSRNADDKLIFYGD